MNETPMPERATMVTVTAGRAAEVFSNAAQWLTDHDGCTVMAANYSWEPGDDVVVKDNAHVLRLTVVAGPCDPD
ncbi:hypothetical protein [Actinokineospora sp.]|uniref:hypothetical protein n=1 Tax=Actinokineospora sp. TaxID=1872133 RepID=UPI003D6B8042